MGHYVKIADGFDGTVTVGAHEGESGDTLLLTDEEYADLPAAQLDGNPLIDLGEDVSGATVISIPISLADITGAGDVVTNYPLQGHGKITQVAFVATDPPTTASKAVTLNLEIGTTNLTGGVVALTSANLATLGAVRTGTAVTANNEFNDGDTLSVEAASVTAFAEGAGVLLITVE